MILETPVDEAPPVISTVNIPEPLRAYCNKWGNLTVNPIKVIEENHGHNFIKVLIYAVDGKYYYGYNLKLSKVILQKQAKIQDSPLGTDTAAWDTARSELLQLASARKLKETFELFDKIIYNQPELF
jgi:hypothetical protein